MILTIVFLLVVLTVLGGAAAVFMANVREAARRREAFAAWAHSRGMSYTAKDDGLPLRYPFTLFARGHSRGCENVVSGTWDGVSVYLADYWYVQQRGKEATTLRYSVALLSVAAYLPPLQVERENAGTRLLDRMGFRDIQFESHEFNQRFQVRADDREFAFKLLDGRMIDWLLETDGDHCYEVNGGWVLAYIGRLSPELAPTVLGATRGFATRIPRVVWADYGGSSS